MHCSTFCVILVLLLLSIPAYIRYLSHNCGKHGMVGYRQIRDDPNHTYYLHHTFEDVNPTLVWGDTQY